MVRPPRPDPLPLLSPSVLPSLCASLQVQSSPWLWGPALGSPMFASSFCYGFWIQHIWIPGPRCVVATATSVPLVNTGAHPLQSREQNNCVTFFCHEIEMSSLLLPPVSPHPCLQAESLKAPDPSRRPGCWCPLPLYLHLLKLFPSQVPHPYPASLSSPPCVLPTPTPTLS